MRRFAITMLAAALTMGAAPAHRPSAPSVASAPIALQQQSGTAADTAARQLMAQDLADARARGDRPAVFVGSADIGGERPALFVQLQSGRECGSAGCSITGFEWDHGHWQRILDGAIGKIAVSRKKTRGHYDLLTTDDHFVWTGTAYRSVNPAPTLDLRPKPPRR